MHRAKFAVLILGIAFALFWGEVLVRLFSLAPVIQPIEINKEWGDFYTFDYKHIRYLPKPGSPGINQAGFKDREFSLEKPPGTFRILLLGDSIVYGLCYSSGHIPLGHRVSEKLEALLNSSDLAAQTGRHFEVFNFGVTGFDAEQEIDLLELKGMQYAPDLVVSVYCLNDDTEMSAEIDELNSKKSEWSNFRRWENATFGRYLMWSHLYRFVYQRTGLLFSKSEDNNRDTESDTSGATVADAYRRLKELSVQGNFQVLIAINPLIEDFVNYPELWEHERTTSQAKAEGFDLLDLLPAYRDAFGSDPTPVSCGEILHPNESGHELMAKEIFKKISEDRGILIR